MLVVPDYNLEDASTWKVIRERDVISDEEDKRFQDELIRIAGVNPFGEPNLVRRWGGTFIDPMSEEGALKYFLSNNEPTLIGFVWDENGKTDFARHLVDVPSHVLAQPKYNNERLGERRHIVEVWRSPSFLENSGRYAESVRRDPETGEILLKEFPRQGCYDYFLRLETEDETYHAADGEALEGIRRLWNYQQKPLAEREIDLQKYNELATADKNRRINNIWA